MDFDDPHTAQWMQSGGKAMIRQLELFRKGSFKTRLSWSTEHRGDGIGLNPVFTCKTLVGQLRSVAGEESVGYGWTWKARRASQLAVIPVGYADRYSRALDNCGRVLIRRRSAPVVNRVCMTILMADATDILEVSIEDRVVPIRRQVNGDVPVEEPTSLSDSVNNAILARLSPAVSRSVV